MVLIETILSIQFIFNNDCCYGVKWVAFRMAITHEFKIDKLMLQDVMDLNPERGTNCFRTSLIYRHQNTEMI